MSAKKSPNRKRPLLIGTVAQDTLDFYNTISEMTNVPKGRLMDKMVEWVIEDYGFEGMIERAMKKDKD